MQFEQFLREFQEKLRGAASSPEESEESEEAEESRKDPEKAKVIAKQASKKALDYVFGIKREELDKFRPTQKQTRDFVDELQSAILKESKTLSADRVAALNNVLAYNETPGKPRFADIDPHVFAFQLALRIREPSLMDQREAGVCGEASLMTFFAKNTPSAFAEYATSLMRNGKAKLHNLTIEPAGHTVSGWGPRRGMPEADIVTMGSLGLGLFTFLEGTSSSTVSTWLSNAGFRNVSDKVVTLPGLSDQKKLRDSLVEAATAVSAKKLVIMAIHGELVKYLEKVKLELFGKSELSRTSGADFMGGGIGVAGLEPRANPLRGTDHWILVSHLEVKPTGVTIIKLYSWRHSMQGKFKTDAFLTYYGGCIVAEPPT